MTIQQTLIRLLLLPFAALFGLIISVRNGLYESGMLRSVKFNLPVIGVGNLSLGGAGKTPHVEYLVRLLTPYVEVGTLSRGYKRSTKGFKMISRVDNALSAGDEPLQFFLKFKQLKVAVSESRSLGIPSMLSAHPEIQTIILDDSYQHRSVTPGLNILLTEFNYPYVDDVILPAGRLREWKSAADRADIIIVSKCPDEVSAGERSVLTDRLHLKNNQEIYFSRYIYDDPYGLLSSRRFPLARFDNLLLLCAIANEEYLLTFLDKMGRTVSTMIFEDHHYFTAHEMSVLKQQFINLPKGENAIITTEKDATRLLLHKEFLIKENLPVYALPIRVSFLFEEQKKFDDRIKEFLLNFKA